MMSNCDKLSLFALANIGLNCLALFSTLVAYFDLWKIVRSLKFTKGLLAGL